MKPDVPTWHYGIVARWWAEFNTDGPEIDFFRTQIDRFGQPALDAGCGTGRLLIPWLKAGIDVDGSDVSGDMLALCRERATREGVSPRLYRQALHELNLPRKYRTIVLCGVFGIGGNREYDLRALERLYEHLEPGGALVLDDYLPYKGGGEWDAWTTKGREGLPYPFPDPYPPREASGGSALRVRARLADLDRLEQVATLEMWAEEFRDERIVTEERSSLKTCLYFRNELEMMLECAGFHSIEVFKGYELVSPTANDEIIVFVARK